MGGLDVTKSLRPLWTPILLRWGIFVSFRRTFAAIIIFYGILGVFALLAGAFLPWLQQGAVDLALLLIVVAAGILTLRKAVFGFDELFDAFDLGTESRLKLYTSIRNRLKKEQAIQRRKDLQDDVRRLFQSEDKYEQFREEIHEIMFPSRFVKSEIVWLAAAVICWLVYTLLWYFYQDPLSYALVGFVVFPWTHLAALFGTLMNLVWFLFGFSAIRIIYDYYCVTQLLEQSRNDFKIWKYITTLREGTDTEVFAESSDSQKPEFMSYQQFYLHITKIGRHIYTLTLAAIFLIVAGVIRQAFYVEIFLFGQTSWITWLLALIVVPGAIAIFLVPQIGLHRVLDDAKDAILKCWEKDYGEYGQKVVALLRHTHHVKPQQSRDEALMKIQTDLDTIRVLIQDLRVEPTWSFGIPGAITASAVSLVPTLYATAQTLLLGWI